MNTTGVATTATDQPTPDAHARGTLLDFLDWLRENHIRLMSIQQVTDTIDVSEIYDEQPIWKDIAVDKNLPHPLQGRDLVHHYLDVVDNQPERHPSTNRS
ncbi:hypothetical protein GS896_27655 [Rhodococcus hoagii]|nr:hypothetical protein [Prescottella equi]MBM4654029.1 hypothetical protein [Prescottella equi]MBM4719709.1 hypothetical protein [Prescottella equi]NKR23505.1 hypothetical protein [Prescottella equi]NKT56341.1 hypothetical protein [Prescottella equi]